MSVALRPVSKKVWETFHSDHQALVAIFCPSKSFPVIAAARLLSSRAQSTMAVQMDLLRLPQENLDYVKDDTDMVHIVQMELFKILYWPKCLT